MTRVVSCVAAAFLVAGACIAQSIAQNTGPSAAMARNAENPPRSAPRKPESQDDAVYEQAHREMQLAAMQRARSGPDGRLAPELRAKALAHFQRMKHATLVDPGKKQSLVPRP